MSPPRLSRRFTRSLGVGVALPTVESCDPERAMPKDDARMPHDPVSDRGHADRNQGALQKAKLSAHPKGYENHKEWRDVEGIPEPVLNPATAVVEEDRDGNEDRR